MAAHQNKPLAFTPGNTKQSCLPLKVATWNVRTLNDGEMGIDKTAQLGRDMERYGIDLCCISEVKWPGSGVKVFGAWHLAYSGSAVGLKRHGVGILMNAYAKANLVDVVNISDRLMKATFRLGRKATYYGCLCSNRRQG